MSMFSRIREGLSKTREGVLGKVTRMVVAKATIDDETVDAIEEALIAADVGPDGTAAIVESLRQRVKTERYADSAEFQNLLREEVRKQFAPAAGSSHPYDIPDARPYVILVVGVNGAGKTTTVGKLANNYRLAGYAVTIAAADTFRAAADEQLDVWAQRAGASIIRQTHGSDPAAVAFDAVASATARKADVVIVDTAGRLHTRVNLMEELKKIRRVIQKQNPSAPHEVLLVIDGSTGQNGLRQATEFHKAVNVTGLIVTKLDGTAKGGIVLAISRAMNIPVRFIGVGEQIDDLQPFDRETFVDALFDTEGDRTG